MFTDTHSHLYVKEFQEDLEDVLNRADEAGVRAIFLPGIDRDSLQEMEKLTHTRIRFFKMAGIHPCSVQESAPVTEIELFDLCSQPNRHGVGETGLDYYWSRDSIPQQKESLRMHCRVAKAVGKPVILHNRDSSADLLDLIKEQQDGSLKGIWHCFTGSAEEAKRALDLGLFLGVGGVSTFKNSGVGEVVSTLPLESLLLETDAPYLAPVPFRGKRNEPSYLIHIAEHLSGLMEVSPEHIAEITTQNAERLFGVTIR
ncbi:MAG: TatD family deoxyribonuclease [Balneolaceae bacterium]|nr:MAG: TatD family deoxyribonuclease [Balneolaceae bacterium]